jgi:AGZA family xanthine/uracil permease-like MFS transporter
MFERLFQLSANRTTVRTEITAGLTTFAAMAYILAVNPAILSVSGMDAGAIITATALASALMTAVMALATNYPLALAPGMGMNAFFAYTICVGHGIRWQAALGMTFLSGLLFLALTVAGVRRKIVEAIPVEMKAAISCGIGLFILFIGLKNGGIVVASTATFVSVGNFSSPGAILVLFGIVLTAILIQRRVRGAIILGVVVLSVIGAFLPDGAGGSITHRPQAIAAAPASLAPTFMALDVGYVVRHIATVFPLLLALLFVDLFDNMGTLIGVCSRAGLLDEKGALPKIGRALAADAAAAMVGATLGTSTVTSYIESAAGVEEGGRTGLTSLVVAACFLLSLFFHPLIRVIPPQATAPALVLVGVYMMQGIARVPLADFASAVPAVLMIVLMPLTFSISEGIAIGFVVYVAVMIGVGRGRQLSVVACVLAALFALHLFFR